MDCVFCGDVSYTIEDREHWTVCLNIRQEYLGRLVVPFTEHVEAATDISRGAWTELHAIMAAYERRLTAVFAPDRLNYALLGNEVPHLHLHIIPRYRDQREFAGRTFTDDNYGGNHAPYDREAFSDDVLQRIADAVRSA